MTNIHPTAVIGQGAFIDDSCTVGPYCVIGENVKLGKNNHLKSHVVVEGFTTIGDNNSIFPFACIGQSPQDLKFDGEKSELIIGSNNLIREYCTINPGTLAGGMITKIGNNCLFMANSHIAHDCLIGNNVICANSVALAGHVKVGDFTVIGGLAGVKQFVRIGEYVMVGGMSGVEKDITPYGIVTGNRARIAGINLVGLKRRGFSKNSISEIKEAYEILYENTELLFAEKLRILEENYPSSLEVRNILDFINNHEENEICKA